MILTIWRHGAAEKGVNDRLRELTSSGRDDVRFGGHRFHEACIAWNIPRPHRILHSPLVRTAQTAEIIAATFTHATVTAVAALQPGSDVAAVDALVCDFNKSDSDKQHTLLVSHQPLVSELVDYYLGGGSSVPFLAPGGLVTLSLELLAPHCGAVQFWAMPPAYETVA
jgi:phosphohistidine phosphatase